MSDDFAAPSQETITARHEIADVKPGVFVVFALALVGTVVLLLGISALFIRWDMHSLNSGRPIPSPMPPADVPEPRLQPSHGHESMDWEDLQQLREREDAILNSYAWIGPNKRAARIPIDRAMDLLIQRGLPTRSASGGQP